jgi:2-hydroxy-3-keto-5-methylthiopentenyl-1-phosphate phosphatase
MCELNKKSGLKRIDPCMKELVKWLNNKHKTILCCCGHGKYNPSLIVKEYRKINGKRKICFVEIFSGNILKIKKNALDKDENRFYKKDKEGYYYIPEVINKK